MYMDASTCLRVIKGGILGETPLQWAIRKRAIRMVCMLLEKDADIHHKDVEGLDALGLAVKFGYVELAFIFLWKGADANTQDAQGRTLLLTVWWGVLKRL
jgi:ankyrin repeat protein